MMKPMQTLLIAIGVAAGLAGTMVAAQVTGTFESHLAAAKAAAGTEHKALLDRICTQVEEMSKPPAPRPPSPASQASASQGPRRQGPPPVAEWHAEPVKVFDNLYFVGMTEYSAWAVTTSQGIILIDTIYDYSVEDEVVNGLKKLGLDPADIKYALVSHAHTDHIGGAKYLQDHFGTRVVMSIDRLGRRGEVDPGADSAEARHRDEGRRQADARRHDDHDVSHAGPHAGNDLDDLPGEGSRHAAHRGDVGRHRVQLPAQAGELPAVHPIGRALPGHRPEGGRRSAAAARACAPPSPSRRPIPRLSIAVVSKVYPMRSHTVSAEGGAAGVIAQTTASTSTPTTRSPAATGCAIRTPSRRSSRKRPRSCCSWSTGAVPGAASRTAASPCGRSAA